MGLKGRRIRTIQLRVYSSNVGDPRAITLLVRGAPGSAVNVAGGRGGYVIPPFTPLF